MPAMGFASNAPFGEPAMPSEVARLVTPPPPVEVPLIPGGRKPLSDDDTSSVPLPPPGRPPKTLKEGDWICNQCSNVNFAKRTKCNVCQTARPRVADPLDEVPHLGGPPGLFKRGDWPCTHCGNVNWARRDKCNLCNSPKPSTGEEPRMGRAGGHFDLQDPSDRNQHDSDGEDFDEFGRRKKRNAPFPGPPSRSNPSHAESTVRSQAASRVGGMCFPPPPPCATSHDSGAGAANRSRPSSPSPGSKGRDFCRAPESHVNSGAVLRNSRGGSHRSRSRSR